MISPIYPDYPSVEKSPVIPSEFAGGSEIDVWLDASDLVEEILDPFDPADSQRIAWLTGRGPRNGPPPLPRRMISTT